MSRSLTVKEEKLVTLIKQTCQSNPEDEEAYLSLKTSVSPSSVYCLCHTQKRSLAVWPKFNMYFSFVKQKVMSKMHKRYSCALKFEFDTFVNTLFSF